VQRYLNDEPVEAGPPSASYKLRKFARKHRKSLGVAAAFALLLGLGSAVSIGQAVRAKRAEQATGPERDQAGAEKERGDDEAALAKAVSDCLQEDLLGQADIDDRTAGRQRNKDVTVRDLLDRAAQGIEARFKGRERTEAAIRLTIGMAYRSLGEYPEAQ